MRDIFLSIVLPVYNEEGCLSELYQRLTKTLTALKGISGYELVFVDDGSRDRSWPMIQSLHEKDPRVVGVRFSRNFGHHMALSAGINIAKGQAVVMMDSDLQDQPEEIPKLYAKFLEGYDVVYGVRRQKKHGLIKQCLSLMFNKVMAVFSDTQIKINSHIFRIMSRRVVDVFNQFGERDRYIIGLISFAGFKETGVDVEHGVRAAGQTKYSFRKMMRLGMNSITAFSMRPLQVASWVGFFLAFLGFIAIIYLFILKIFFGMGILGWPSTMVVIIFIGGIQMLFLGLIGEYIGRIFLEVKRRPLYVIDTHLK